MYIKRDIGSEIGIFPILNLMSILFHGIKNLCGLLWYVSILISLLFVRQFIILEKCFVVIIFVGFSFSMILCINKKRYNSRIIRWWNSAVSKIPSKSISSNVRDFDERIFSFQSQQETAVSKILKRSFFRK